MRLLCQYLDTIGLFGARGKVIERRLWLVGGVLMALAVLAGSIQAGLLAPQLRSAGEQGVDNAWFETIQNVSWRTWTITDVHLKSGASTARIAGRVVRLTLHNGRAPLDGRVGPSLTRLVVSPGHDFDLRLSNAGIGCRVPLGQAFMPPAPTFVYAVVSLATPFGSRDIQYRFAVNRC